MSGPRCAIKAAVARNGDGREGKIPIYCAAGKFVERAECPVGTGLMQPKDGAAPISTRTEQVIAGRAGVTALAA